MKAAVVEQVGMPLVVHSDWPDRKCGPTDAVLRVEANGMCLTDHHIWQGGWPWVGIETFVPMVLGHEYCGVVEAVGSALQGFQSGDRVVVPFDQARVTAGEWVAVFGCGGVGLAAVNIASALGANVIAAPVWDDDRYPECGNRGEFCGSGPRWAHSRPSQIREQGNTYNRRVKGLRGGG